jgi:hypothetical protein
LRRRIFAQYAMKSSARGYRTVEFITTIGYLIGLKPK